MGEPTDACKTEPGPSPLDRLLAAVEEIRPEVLPGWRDLALAIDLEGVLNDLDDHDGRHVVGATLYGLLPSGGHPQVLRQCAAQIASDGAGPLHDPAAAAEALRRIANLAEL